MGRGKFSVLVGVRRVGFARTAQAHGKMWFGKRKAGLGRGTSDSRVAAELRGIGAELLLMVKVTNGI